MTPWLTIVGVTEAGADVLPPRARAHLAEARLVVGGARHLSLMADLIGSETLTWPYPLTDAFPAILGRRGQKVVVLASGDPNWFGVAETLRAVVPVAETLYLPAPSAASLACARLGWALQDVELISACGRPLESVIPLLTHGARIVLLSADETTPGALAALLRAHGFGASKLHILEALGGPRERIRTISADQGLPPDIARLNLVAIEAIGAPGLPRIPGLPEAAFDHDNQITKREVRAVTLAALAPRPDELLWDIGCGSGSVAIEWMRVHAANRAIGIEPREDRAARAARNAAVLGVPTLRIVRGTAPEALAGLPPPDAVFIGGGAGDPGVLDTAWAALRPGGRLVVNAVTVETQALLIATRGRLGGSLTRIAIERLDAVGPELHGFRPAMAVIQFAVEKT